MDVILNVLLHNNLKGLNLHKNIVKMPVRKIYKINKNHNVLF